MVSKLAQFLSTACTVSAYESGRPDLLTAAFMAQCGCHLINNSRVSENQRRMLLARDRKVDPERLLADLVYKYRFSPTNESDLENDDNEDLREGPNEFLDAFMDELEPKIAGDSDSKTSEDSETERYQSDQGNGANQGRANQATDCCKKLQQNEKNCDSSSDSGQGVRPGSGSSRAGNEMAGTDTDESDMETHGKLDEDAKRGIVEFAHLQIRSGQSRMPGAWDGELSDER
ncbi:hypothetical protein BGZ63DRAFT_405531 [Mariannaea sp. PMI_226]|nr:hypothetical protein BGZ63DRAFT_405531 [Mariannaea sp. PMI_226]